MYVISRPGPLRLESGRRGGRSLWKRPRTTPIVREDRVLLKGRVAFDLVVAAQAAPGCLLVLVFSCFIIPICFNSLTSSARFHRRYPHRSRISLFPCHISHARHQHPSYHLQRAGCQLGSGINNTAPYHNFYDIREWPRQLSSLDLYSVSYAPVF